MYTILIISLIDLFIVIVVVSTQTNFCFCNVILFFIYEKFLNYSPTFYFITKGKEKKKIVSFSFQVLFDENSKTNNNSSSNMNLKTELSSILWRVVCCLSLRDEIDRQVNRPRSRWTMSAYTMTMNVWMTTRMVLFLLALHTSNVCWLDFTPAFASFYHFNSWHSLPMLLCGNLFGFFIGVITFVIFEPHSKPNSIVNLFVNVYEWIGINVDDIVHCNRHQLRKVFQYVTVKNWLQDPCSVASRIYEVLNNIYSHGGLINVHGAHRSIVPIRFQTNLQCQFLPKEIGSIIRYKAFVLWILCEMIIFFHIFVLFIIFPWLIFSFMLPSSLINGNYILYVVDMFIVFGHFAYLFRLLLCLVYTFYMSYMIILLDYHHLNKQWTQLATITRNGARQQNLTKSSFLRKVMSIFFSHVRETCHTMSVNHHTSRIASIYANFVSPFILLIVCNFLLGKFDTLIEKIFYSLFGILLNFILMQAIAINILITTKLHSFARHFITIERRLRTSGIITPLLFRFKYMAYYERINTNTNMVAAEFIGFGQITAPKLLNYIIMYFVLLLSLANLLR